MLADHTNLPSRQGKKKKTEKLGHDREIKRLALAFVHNQSCGTIYEFCNKYKCDRVHRSLGRLMEKDPALISILEIRNKADPSCVAAATEALVQLIPTVEPDPDISACER